MNQQQGQEISMDEVLMIMGDLYLQLRLSQKRLIELTGQLQKEQEEQPKK